MPFFSGPWDGQQFFNNDWRKLYRSFPDRLVGIGSLSRSSSNREITWSGADGMIQGVYFRNTVTDVINVPTVTAPNRRIDWLVLQYDPSQVDLGLRVTFRLVQGAEALNPSEPVLTREENGIWQMPIGRIGPYGNGTMRDAPFQDLRLHRSYVQYMDGGENITTAQNRMRAYPAGHGDLGYNSKGLWVVENGSWIPVGDGSYPESFSVSDAGWPRSVSKGSGTSPVYTNQLTIPSRPWHRRAMISAQHYLTSDATTREWDSALFFGSDSARRRARHPKDHNSPTASTVTLSHTISIAAGQSVRVRLGILFVRDAGASNVVTISSGSTTYNNINVLTVPTPSSVINDRTNLAAFGSDF